MYRVFRNIISQIIWARKILKMRGDCPFERGREKREKYKQSDAKSSRT